MALVSPEIFAKQTVSAVQEYSLLAGRAVGNLFSRPRYWADIYTQMDSIGYGSLPIVILTGFLPAACWRCSRRRRFSSSARSA